MEDDIDIEEHDVLDNPALRNIFPDLSVIKREIFDDYEGIMRKEILPPGSMVVIPAFSRKSSIAYDNVTEDQPELTSDSIEVKNISYNNIESLQNSKSKFDGNVTVCFNTTKNSPMKSSRIILGSRPQVKLVLDDVHPYLMRSKRFCKTCFILFSDNKELNKHILKTHLSNECRQRDNPKITHMCKTCNKSFFYEVELKKHMSQNHKKLNLKAATSSQSDFESVIEENPSGSEQQDKIDKSSFQSVNKEQKKGFQNIEQSVIAEHECNKCGSKYKQRCNLIRHIRKKHGKNTSLRSKKVIRKNLKTHMYKTRTKTNKNLVIKNAVNVLKNKLDPLVDQDGKEKVNKCFHCKKIFNDQKIFINHLYQILQDKKYSKLEDKNEEEDVCDDGAVKKDKSGYQCKEYIRCPKCFYYFKYMQVYVAHMIKKHQMKNIPVVNLVSYENNCYFCGDEFVTWKQYNIHMQKMHSDQFNKYAPKSIDEELQADITDIMACKFCLKTYKDPQLLTNHYRFKHKTSFQNSSLELNLNISVFDNSGEYNDCSFLSILFKCNKCDIHFMFAKHATNHVEHMDMLINWKCPICLRIFKKQDEILHTKQHSFYSHDLKVYDLCETELNKILFNCPKCAVHFNEENFLCHFPKCGSQTRKSSYCKTCDILIDSDSIISHDQCHKTMNMKTDNFIFVESNVKPGKNVRTSDRNTKSNKTVLEDNNSKVPKNELFYCDYCKCCISGQGSKLTCHVEKTCDKIPKYICKHCGLLVTARGQISHKKCHIDGKTFNLQDWTFFDLRSGQRIKPPIPDFPKCDSCGMQFVRKNFIKNTHICNDSNFVVCQTCQGKFSDAAYKLHTKFHNYSLNISSDTLQNDNSPTNENPIREVSNKELIVKVPQLSLSYILETDPNFIYLCNLCQIAFDVYDRVVEHCQAHFLKEIYKYFATKYCEVCDLEYDQKCYEQHCNTHALDNFDKNNIRYLNFDLDFFLQDNRTWLKHVYDGYPGKERSRFVAESIYRYEARVKLTVFQEGPSNLTVYKCEKCTNYVERGSLFKHAKNSCFNLRKHLCSFCGLSFNSYLAKEEHEKVHSNKEIEIQASSYRIVIFNREEDKILNEAISERKKYVLYQCRNCDFIVNIQKYSDHICDRSNMSKCKECGLLFQSKDYKLHCLKHQECNDYYPRNIKVLLCGQKSEKDLDKGLQDLPPTFRGIVHDYTFYQCTNCHACMKDCQSARHDCDLKYKCELCDLFFVNKQHSKLHENDPDFVKRNINIIPLKTKVKKTNDVGIEKSDNRALIRKSITEEDTFEGAATPKIKQVVVYKCPCELNFLESATLLSHLHHCGAKFKNGGQKCSKCELVFTPKTLFNHVLKHHSNKSISYKFKVIDFCETEKVLYKCSKCALHFPTYGDAYEHSENCKSHSDGKQCTVCELSISSKHYKAHEQLHLVPTNKFFIREVVSNENVHAVEDDTDSSSVFSGCVALSKQQLQKLDLSKYSNVIFKCKQCSFNALDQMSLVCHLLSNVHDDKNLEVCSKCQYSFSMSSMITHVYVHHNKWKLLKNDLIIEERDDLLLS